jgi:hypothetical protein
MRNKHFQAFNVKCPYYFLDPAHAAKPDDMLILGKIVAINEARQMEETFALPRGTSAFYCKIESIFSAAAKY